MSDTITAEQYRTITGGTPRHVPQKTNSIAAGLSAHPIPTQEDRNDEEIKAIRHHLRAMGHYFDLPEKSVKFYIAQLEMSGKI